MVWQSSAHLGAFSTAPRAWLPIPADHLTRAVDVQVADPDSVLNFYKAMLSFRGRHPALIKGSTRLLDMPEGVLGFTRTWEREELVCIFNMRETAAIARLPDDIAPVTIDTPLAPLEPAGGSLSLPPFGAYIGAL